MGKKIGIGILGCANIAKKSAIPAFQSLDNARVVSIASRDRKKAEEYASFFSIPVYESYDALLKNPQVEAVYIPLPPGLHEEWIVKSLRAGKHVLCEKPLALNLKSTKKTVELAKKTGKVLYENFMCDFHPQHRKVLSLIKEGKIGQPFLFQGSFCIPKIENDAFRYNQNLGGGALYELGWYPVFLSRKIFQSEPLSVASHLFYDKTGLNISGIAQLVFPGGKSAQLVFNLDSLYENSYSVLGNKGKIVASRAYAIPPELKPPLELIKKLKEDVLSIEVPAANQFKLIFDDFCQTVLRFKIDPDRKEQVYKKILAQAEVLEEIKISSTNCRRQPSLRR